MRHNILWLVLIATTTFWIVPGMDLVHPCFGDNHVILDEHFDRDPRVHSWPWTTPGPGYAWYFNTRNWPVPRNAGPPFTNCGWGWQDLVFSTHVIRRAETPGALWCAYSTLEGPQRPQWPDPNAEDRNEYWNNMNAWAFWGPFDLREAVGGEAAFWFLMEVEGFSYDSLSVCIEPGDDYLLLDNDPFRRRCSIGKTFTGHTEDWQFREVHFDSLYVNGEQMSYVIEGDEPGERRCWLCFVWHSNEHHIAGAGAFIDDVIVLWDDGLLDLFPVDMWYGYVFSEDSINWSDQIPGIDEEVYLKLDWECVGSNDSTPPFTIQCHIDDELFYSEVRQVQGSDDTTYVTITDELWHPDEEGEYFLHWMLDSEEDVDESREDNNTRTRSVLIDYNPPPIFEITYPDTSLIEVACNGSYPVRFTISDENEEDQDFAVFIFWTKDTTGWNGNHELMYDWNAAYGSFDTPRGDHEFVITFSPAVVDSGDVIYFAGVSNDGEPANNTWDFADGTLLITGYVSVEPGADEIGQPLDYGLTAVYPNPFNRIVTISFNIRVPGDYLIRIMDLRGRTLYNENVTYSLPGPYSMTWDGTLSNDPLPSGVYLFNLSGIDNVSQRLLLIR